MEAVYYTKQNKKYDVYKCVEADIAVHYLKVEALANGGSVDGYKERMFESITTGYAYKIESEGVLLGFMYNLVEIRNGVGTSIWGSGDTISMMLLMKTAFETFPKHKILVDVYERTLGDFKSLAIGSSIRNNHNYNTPISIHIKPLQEKFARLFNMLGIQTCPL